MAAAIHPRTLSLGPAPALAPVGPATPTIQVPSRDRHRTTPSGPGRTRPDLRLIEGGRSPRALAEQQRFLRRRIVVGVMALVLAMVGLRGAASAVTWVVAGSAGAGDTAVAGTTHRAAPGDTLWEIAGRYAPQVDPRVAMDDLVAINGGGALQVGQQVLLPASWFQAAE